MISPQPRIVRPGRALLTTLGLLACSAACFAAAPADDASPERRQTKPAGAARETPQNQTPPRKKKEGGAAVSPQREAAVLAFVRKNHPDLTQLLAYLKDQRPRDYARAIRQMAPVSERLAKMQKNDSERYEVALRSWKVQSRVQLLAARVRMSGDASLRQDLEQALREQIDLKCELLARDRDKFLARAQKFEKQRKQLEALREKSVARQLKMLLRKGKPVKKKKSAKSGSSR